MRGIPARTRDIPVPGTARPPALSAGQGPGSIEALDVDLGPVPKEIVVGEATGLDDLERIAHVPGARVGLALEGGDTLRPEEVVRLSHFRRVHLWLGVPVLPVHLEVLHEVKALLDVTVTVPPGKVPTRTLLGRLSAIGPGRMTLALAGVPTRSRLAPLAGCTVATVSVTLPPRGIGRTLRRALAAVGAPVVVRVPKDADPGAVRRLRGLRLAGLVLGTDANRVAPKVLAAAVRLRAPIRVVVDGGVTAEDLRVLRRVPRLALEVRLAPATEVPDRLVRLLRASAGATGPGWSPAAKGPAAH